MSVENPRLLTTGQVGKMFNVDVSTVRRWTERGLLPFVKTPGGRKKIPESAVIKDGEKLLSTNETAEQLGVSVRTVRYWTQNGLLLHERTPIKRGRIRIKQSVVMQLRRELGIDPA